MKKYYTVFMKNLLIWWNATFTETITLRKMSGPQNAV